MDLDRLLDLAQTTRGLYLNPAPGHDCTLAGWIDGGRAVIVETTSTSAQRWTLSHRLKGPRGAHLRRAAAQGVICAVIIERRSARGRTHFYCVPVQAAPWRFGRATWASLRVFLSNTNPLLPITRWSAWAGPVA